jgi:hypothetical protein
MWREPNIDVFTSCRWFPQSSRKVACPSSNIPESRGGLLATRLPAKSRKVALSSTNYPGIPGHGPREQAALPVIAIRHELPPDQRACPACGGALTELTGQSEAAERITVLKATYHVRATPIQLCDALMVLPTPSVATIILDGDQA